MFRANVEAMEAHISTFRDVEQKVLDLAESAREKFTKRGKLLPRDRINRLLDRAVSFWSCVPWPVTRCTMTRTVPWPAAGLSLVSAG